MDESLRLQLLLVVKGCESAAQRAFSSGNAIGGFFNCGYASAFFAKLRNLVYRANPHAVAASRRFDQKSCGMISERNPNFPVPGDRATNAPAMRVYHHRLYFSWLTALLSLGIGLGGAGSGAGAPPEKLSAVARDVTSTPGVVELARRHRSLPEDEFSMRFQLLAAAPMTRWSGLDLTTQSRNLPSEARDGVVTVTLPNGGQCFLRLAQTGKQEAVYELTFSSTEVGLATKVPVKTGNVLLLGSPQNNANDASFVLMVITFAADR